MRINEISFPTLGNKNKKREEREKKLWFEHYFQAREKAKEIFNIETDTITIPYPQDSQIVLKDWDESFIRDSFEKKLKPLLSKTSKVPLLLKNDKNVINTALRAKKLCELLDNYIKIDDYLKSIPRLEQGLEEGEVSGRWMPGVIPNTSNNFPSKTDTLPKFVYQIRGERRELHNEISLLIRDFIYPRYLEDLMTKSKKTQKI